MSLRTRVLLDGDFELEGPVTLDLKGVGEIVAHRLVGRAGVGRRAPG